MRLPTCIAVLAALSACASSPANPDGMHNGETGAAASGEVEALPKVLTFLLASHDHDHDGQITIAEYDRGERSFRNLDRNHDDLLTHEDFGRRDRRGGGGRADRGRRGARERPTRTDEQWLSSQRRFVELFATFLNTDGQAGIARSEWQEMIDAMQPDDDGVIDGAQLSNFMGDARMGRMAKMVTRQLARDLDRDGDGDVEVADLEAMFAALDSDDDGVIAASDGVKMPPGVGEMAPDFTIARADDLDALVTLSSFRGKKPVALIFGSYT